MSTVLAAIVLSALIAVTFPGAGAIDVQMTLEAELTELAALEAALLALFEFVLFELFVLLLAVLLAMLLNELLLWLFAMALVVEELFDELVVLVLFVLFDPLPETTVLPETT